MNKSVKICLEAALMACVLLVLATPAGAVPPPPAVYYGTVMINGANIPDGTIVSAVGNGDRVYDHYPSLTYQGMSYYTLTIPGDDPDTGEVEGAVSGEVIRFKIGDVWAAQTTTWAESGGGAFNLTATQDVTWTPLYLPAVLKNNPVVSAPTYTPTANPTPTQTATSAWATSTPVPAQITIVGAEDTFLYVDDKDTPQGRAGEMQIKTSQQSKRPLLRFALPSLPTNAIIESAMMTLYTTPFPYSEPQWPMDVSCYFVKRDWNEEEATWRMATGTQSWGMPGGDDTILDRESTPITSTVVRAPSTPNVFNITSAVRRWVANPASNNGLLLIGDGNIAEYRFYSSREFVPEQYRPRLEITVRIP